MMRSNSLRNVGIILAGLLASNMLQAQTPQRTETATATVTPEVKTLSLSEALQLGVANSHALETSRAKIKAAQARLAQVKDEVIPEVGISGMYLRVSSPTISGPVLGSTSGSSSDSGLDFSKINQVMLAQASASWPVFQGFRVRNDRRMSAYLTEAAQYDANTTQQAVMLNTARAVYQYYELLETRKVVAENLKQEQQRVAEFKNLEAQSLLARNDRLKAALQANNVELALTEVNNSVKIAEYNLIILLGLPEDISIQLDTTTLFPPFALASWEQYLQQGLDNRSELKATEAQLSAMASGIRSSKSGHYPTVALTAGYINAKVPNLITITNALNAGVSVKYSLTGIYKTKHQVQAAQAQYEQAEALQKETTDQVKTEIRNKYLTVQQSLEKLEITERAIEQAEENYKISKNKYEQGLLILSDYLDADVTLLQAKINHATTQADCMVAYYELLESTGNLQQ